MITIIIVAYNSGELLLECVSKALASNIVVRVILSDNNSTDGSIEKVSNQFAQDDRLCILRNKKNLGFATANNQALELVDSEYVSFLNPDCLLSSNSLADMLTTMERYPQAAVAGCLLVNPDGSEQRGARRSMPTPWRSLMQSLYLDKIFKNKLLAESGNLVNKPLPDSPVYIDIVSGALMLVRTNVLKEIGGWDTNYFLHCEDADLCVRFNQSGWKVLFIPNISVIHMKGESSMNRPIFVEWHKHKSMVRFHKKFFYKQYPLLFNWVIWCGIWVRFALIALLLSLGIVSYKKLMGRC